MNNSDKTENTEGQIPESFVFGGFKYVKEDTLPALAIRVDGLQYCIVRCRDAGVHAGYVASRNGREVKILKSRRLWRWHGRTLSGLALEGTTNKDLCKYAPEIPEIEVLDACEIIPCTEAGKRSIQEMKEWVNE